MAGPIDVTSALNSILDKHGYGFQYAVLAAAGRAFKPGSGSPWRKPVSEFPVEVNDSHSHIDIILEHYRRPIMIVGECKRANPAVRNWCFLRAPFKEAHLHSEDLFAEALEWTEDGDPICRVRFLFRPESVYHLGIEVKSEEKGNPCDKGRGAIEDAAGQVLRGVNGLIQFLGNSSAAKEQRKNIQIIPVIFTTARLWATNANLGQADLLTGKLDLSRFPLEEKRWVFLHYAQTPGLKHSLRSLTDDTQGPYDEFLTDALYAEFIRPIGIVSAGAIEDFLCMGHWTM